MLTLSHRTHPEPYYASDGRAPDAPAILMKVYPGNQNRYFEWVAVVVRCPFCGESHDHVVCTSQGDPFKYLGARHGTCSFFTGIPVRYNLIVVEGWEINTPLADDELSWLDANFPMRAMPIPSGARKPIDADLRADVWDKSRGFCWYCGGELHPFRNFHVDHMKPVIDGGGNDLDNLVPCCTSCNSRKGSRPAEYLRKFIGSGVFWGERE